MPKRMDWEVIDVFFEKRKPHWMFGTRQSLPVKIICLALFGRASLLVESKAALENTWKSKTVTTMLTC